MQSGCQSRDRRSIALLAATNAACRDLPRTRRGKEVFPASAIRFSSRRQICSKVRNVSAVAAWHAHCILLSLQSHSFLM